MRTILFSLVLMCAVACTPTQPQQAQSNQIAAASIQNVVQPIKVAKKTRNCANKQTFEGARGGIFHYDTAKNGNVYKHYNK